MLCPICSLKLERTKYENLPLKRCPKCKGFLVEGARLKSIQNRRSNDSEQLEGEAKSKSHDTLIRIRCPECRVTMEKRRRHCGDTEFHIDECQKCRCVWLDCGEIAKLQIAYEESPQGAERKRMQDRLKNMSESEKAELNARIAALPEYEVFHDIIGHSGDYEDGYFEFDWTDYDD